MKIVSDNLSVVMCQTRNHVHRDPKLMGWVRRFFLLCAFNQIQVMAEHVASKENVRADALSRGLFQRFRALMPGADRDPSHWD